MASSNNDSSNSCDSKFSFNGCESSYSSSFSSTTWKLSISKELITCRLCREVYSDPRVLPCFHTLCFSCIKNLCISNCILVCPICSNELLLKSVDILKMLPVNTVVENMIRSHSDVLFCTNCKDKRIITFAKCLNCDRHMCHLCAFSHDYVSCLESQTSNSPVSSSSDNLNTVYKINCSDHDLELTHYCYTCKHPICNLCTVNDHNSISHHYELIKDVIDNLMKLITKRKEEWNYKMSELRYKMLNLEKMKNNGQLQYNKCQQEMKSCLELFQYFLNCMNENRTLKLEYQFEIYMKNCNFQEKILWSHFEKLKAMNDFCCQYLKYGHVIDTLLFIKKFENSFNDIKNFNLDLEDPNFTFNFNAENIKQAVLNNFGGTSINDLTDNFSLLGFNELDNAACSSPLIKIPYSIKSVISREQFSYDFRFGDFGNLEGQFSEPNGVAISNSDEIIVTDTNNNRVQVFDKSGKFQFLFGSLPSGMLPLLTYPNRVAVMPKSGNIVVTERAPTHQVQIFTKFGIFIRKFGADILQYPRAVTVDRNDNIIIVECKVMRIFIFDSEGNVLEKFQCTEHLEFPNSVAVNDTKEIFISDNRSHCVVVFNYSGQFLRKIGGEGYTNFPIGVCITGSGNVLISDNHNNFNLTIFTQDGTLLHALESKVKHAQCYDVAINCNGVLVLTCKDYHVYTYKVNY